MLNTFNSPKDREHFLRKNFSAGTTIIEEGQEGENVFLITQGKVEIRTGTRSNNPRVLAVLTKGEVFGEMAMIDGTYHMASVIAKEPTSVLAISRVEFNKRMERTDPVIRGIIMQIVKRARGASKGIIQPAHEFG